MHDTNVSVYGQLQEIFNNELYQTDLLCIITLYAYHKKREIRSLFHHTKFSRFNLKSN